jgi:VCBS repeat-containing protein
MTDQEAIENAKKAISLTALFADGVEGKKVIFGRFGAAGSVISFAVDVANNRPIEEALIENGVDFVCMSIISLIPFGIGYGINATLIAKGATPGKHILELLQDINPSGAVYWKYEQKDADTYVKTMCWRSTGEPVTDGSTYDQHPEIPITKVEYDRHMELVQQAQAELNALTQVEPDTFVTEENGVYKVKFTNSDVTVIISKEGGATILGSDGVEYIVAEYGNSTIESGGGDDEIHTEGGGNKIKGGEGDDKYYVSNGDTIEDSDGEGEVKFLGATLSGGTKKKGEEGVYKGDGGEYKLSGNTLTFTKGGQTITIENFDKENENGYLGIKLVDLENYAKVSINGGGLSFTVSLDKALDYDVKVSYSVTEGSKYVEDNNGGSVTIKAGSTSASISFKDKDDNVDDDCCTRDPSGPVDFTVALTSVSISGQDALTEVEIDSENKDAKGSAWFDGDDTDCVGNCGCGCTGVVPAPEGSTELNFCSPLVLDLNNNGITSISLAAAKIYFDVDGDGFKEKTAWTENEDGLLAFDKNQDGIINNGNELFGNYTKLSNGTYANNGFEALKEYDLNKDGVIDIKDTIYNHLNVWIDANQNGQTDEGELKTLSELNITSINLNADTVDIQEADNKISHTSSFTQNDEIKTINDVWFEQYRQDSIYDYDKPISQDILFLPNLIGGGRVMNLHESMNEDSVLKQKVEALLTNSQTMTYSSFLNSFKDMMIRWAKVDNVNQNQSRGEQQILNHNYDNPRPTGSIYYIYAYERDLRLLEAFGGRSFSMSVNEQSTQKVVGMEASEMIKNSLNTFLNKQIMFFLTEVLYQDRFVKGETFKTGELVDELGYVLSLSSTQNKSSYSLLLATVINLKGLSVLERLGIDMLNSQNLKQELSKQGINYNVNNEGHIYGTYGNTQVLDNNGQTVAHGGTTIGGKGNDIIYGSNGTDVIEGGDGDDIIYGYDGNDILKGGDGNDTIYAGRYFGDGNYGHDYLEGGRGDDTLYGTERDSTFIYNYGDGHDTIMDSGNVGPTADILRLNDILLDNIKVTKNGNDIVINIIDTEDNSRINGSITIKDGLNHGSIETIYLKDITINWNELISMEDNKYDGYSLFYQKSDGNKIFPTSKLINVLVLNDTNSNDIIVKSNANSNDLIIAIKEEGKSYNEFSKITLKDWFISSDRIQTFIFNEDIILNADDILNLQISNNDDIVRAFANKSLVVDTKGGNDIVHGSSLDDIIEGGKGDDALNGGEGNDTYIYGRGEGKDTIVDILGSDTIIFKEGITKDDLIVKVNSSNDLFIGIKEDGRSFNELDDVILLKDWFIANSRVEYFEFADGTILNANNIISLQGITENDDYIKVGEATSINALGGNDTIIGSSGSDMLIGGKGNDILNGAGGDDIYIYSKGDETDTIYDNNVYRYSYTTDGGKDTLKFSEGIVKDDLIFKLSLTSNDLMIIIKQEGVEDILSTDKIIIKDWKVKNNRIETIEFADGSKMNEEDIVNYASLFNNESIDNIIFVAANSTNNGMEGDDTYIISKNFGKVTIYDDYRVDNIQANGGSDTLVFENGISLDDLIFETSGNDLLIGFKEESKSFSEFTNIITLQNWFANNNMIENFKFADGSNYTASDVFALMLRHGAAYGSSYDDIMMGTANDDIIYGNAGNDTIDGGKGDDTLNGGQGDDTYVYGKGDGKDIIYDDYKYNSRYQYDGGNDTLEFKEGITKDDLIVKFSMGSNDLVIAIKEDGKSFEELNDVITIKDWFNTNNRIENFRFSDGTILNVNGIINLQGTESDDIARFIDNTTSVNLSMGDGNDIVQAGLGNDTIDGGNGNDVISSNNGDDIINGGKGDDILEGGQGDDTYIYGKGDGKDTIYDDYRYNQSYLTVVQKDAGNDTLEFKEGITKDDLIVKFSIGSNDLLVAIKEDGKSFEELNDVIAIKDWFNTNNRIENFRFSDGTILNVNDIINLQGTEGDDIARFVDNTTAVNLSMGDGNDTVQSGSGNDIIDGGNGNDVISSNNGDDIINGGRGDDILEGELGDDTYIYGKGDGKDTILDIGGNDTVKFKEEVTKDDLIVKFSPGSNDLLVAIKEDGKSFEELTDVITIKDWFNVNNRIENFIFSDGTTLDINEILRYQDTTEEDDYLRYLDGDMIIEARKGDDTITGSFGNTKYIYGKGDGKDTITDFGGANDEIVFKDGITQDDIIIRVIGSQTIIAIKEDGKEFDELSDKIILIKPNSSLSHGIEKLSFSDGTSINPSDLIAGYFGTEYDDDIDIDYLKTINPEAEADDNFIIDPLDGYDRVTLGNGSNVITNAENVDVGNGNNVIVCNSNGDDIGINAGDGDNDVSIKGIIKDILSIDLGNGNNNVNLEAYVGEELGITLGNGNNTVNITNGELVEYCYEYYDSEITEYSYGLQYVDISFGKGDNTLNVKTDELSVYQKSYNSDDDRYGGFRYMEEGAGVYASFGKDCDDEYNEKYSSNNIVNIEGKIRSIGLEFQDGNNVLNIQAEALKTSEYFSDSFDNELNDMEYIGYNEAFVNFGNGNNIVNANFAAFIGAFTFGNGDNIVNIKDSQLFSKEYRRTEGFEMYTMYSGGSESMMGYITFGDGNNNVDLELNSLNAKELRFGNGDNNVKFKSYGGYYEGYTKYFDGGDEAYSKSNYYGSSFSDFYAAFKDGNNNIDIEGQFDYVGLEFGNGDNNVNVKFENLTYYINENEYEPYDGWSLFVYEQEDMESNITASFSKGNNILNIDGASAANLSFGDGDNIVNLKIKQTTVERKELMFVDGNETESIYMYYNSCYHADHYANNFFFEDGNNILNIEGEGVFDAYFGNGNNTLNLTSGFSIYKYVDTLDDIDLYNEYISILRASFENGNNTLNLVNVTANLSFLDGDNVINVTNDREAYLADEEGSTDASMLDTTHHLIFQKGFNTININGDIGSDVNISGSTNTIVTLTKGDDNLYVENDGENKIFANFGNDVIHSTGNSNDIYEFGIGDGEDRITDYGGIDKIVFKEGIAKEDIRVSVLKEIDADTNQEKFSLIIVYGEDDKLILTDWFNEEHRIETFEFEGGITINDHEIVNLIGTNENELVLGTEGNNTLDAKFGDDIINGGLGNDTYIFAKGYGHDTLEDSGGFDEIRFKEGIVKNDVIALKEGNDLHVYIKEDGKAYEELNDSILIKNWFSESGMIERLIFANGDSIGLDELLKLDNGSVAFGGTSGDDEINGSDDSEVLMSLDGDDIINAGGGDDIVLGQDGNDTLDGGDGNDMLYGGDGNDTYIIRKNAGDDKIADSSGNDNLLFKDGIVFNDLVINFEGNDLIVELEGTKVTLQDWYFRENRIESFEFEDGTILSANDIQNLNMTNGNDTIKAFNEGAQIDTLDGDDEIISGLGDDTLKGGNGDDTYYVKFSGKDRIFDASGFDTIVFDASVNKENLKIAWIQGSDDILLTCDDYPESSITIESWYDKTNRIESFVFADGTAWDVKDIILNMGTDEDDVYNGLKETSSTIVAKGGDDIISTFEYDDTVYGGDGNDTLDTRGGNDYLEGGTGNDLLIGGSGDDVYVFEGDFGHDVIEDDSGIDAIIFGTDINKESLRFYSYENDTNLYIGIYEEGKEFEEFKNTITIQDWYKKENTIENVLFLQSEEILSLRELTTSKNENVVKAYEEGGALIGTDGDDYLVGGSSQDEIYGLGGNDTILGEDGDDMLDGGKGNDFLNAGKGDDLYIFGYGYGEDTIYDYAYDVQVNYGFLKDDEGIDRWTAIETPYSIYAGDDTIFFANGVTKDDLILSNNGLDLIITLKDSNDKLTIKGFYDENSRIERFQFEDGSTLSASQMEELLFTDRDDNVIFVDNISRSIIGKEGNDTIVAGSGNDILDGKEGDDILDGGLGDDTYVFGRGYGHDTIVGEDASEWWQTNKGFDNILLVGDLTQDSLILQQSGNDLIIAIKEEGKSFEELSDTLTIKNYFEAGFTIENIEFDGGNTISIEDILNSNHTPTLNEAESFYDIKSKNAINGNILASDEDNDALIYSIKQQGVYGRLLIDEEGRWAYIVNENVTVQTDEILVEVSDGNGGVVEKRLVFNINIPSSQPPILDETSSTYDLVGKWIATGKVNAFDPEGDNITYSVSSDAKHGIFTIDENGDWIYKINDRFEGVDTVKIAVTDEYGSSSEKTLSFDIQGINSKATDSSDYIVLDNTANVFSAKGGDDLIYSGDGNDIINGNDGNDTIYAQNGNDIIYADNGNDMVYGGEGNDVIYGNNGDDTLYGNEGNDIIYADEGDDILIGNTGDDAMYGGNGNDTYIFSKGDGKDSINDTNGNDVVKFTSNINKEDISFYMQGNTLNVSYGDNDNIKISRNAIEKFELSNGNYITKQDIEIIIQNINAYAEDNDIQITSNDDIRNSQELMQIVNSGWNE